MKESEAWKAAAATTKDWKGYFGVLAANWKRFGYLVLLMAMMNFLSHGTQDLYPTFLQQQRHFGPGMTTIISVISMIGAIVGGTLIGLYSDRSGRRRAMITAECVCAAGDSAVGFRSRSRVDGRGRVPDAVHGAGRMGRGTGAHQRTLARQGARFSSRIFISDRSV